MSYCGRYLICFLVTVAYANDAVAFQDRDPTAQELQLVDWASGIHVAACGEGILENITTSFRSAFAAVLTEYCQNASECRLKNVVAFSPSDVTLLDGYPRREYSGIRLRFVVILPLNSIAEDQTKHRLLAKEIISKVFSDRQGEIESKMQLYILDYERYPRFDPLTEFMNTAVVPIGFFLMAIMFGLAYWATTLTSESSRGSSWFSDNCRGKGDSEKKRLDSLRARTERDLEEGLGNVRALEKAEKRKKSRWSWRKKSSKVSEEDDLHDSSPGLTRQNALSITSQPFSSDSTEGLAQDADINETSGLTTRHMSQSSTTGKRLVGFSRRLSTFEEVFKERKRRKTRRGGGNGKRGELRWKSTSMALGGFRGK